MHELWFSGQRALIVGALNSSTLCIFDNLFSLNVQVTRLGQFRTLCYSFNKQGCEFLNKVSQEMAWTFARYDIWCKIASASRIITVNCFHVTCDRHRDFWRTHKYDLWAVIPKLKNICQLSWNPNGASKGYLAMPLDTKELYWITVHMQLVTYNWNQLKHKTQCFLWRRRYL